MSANHPPASPGNGGACEPQTYVVIRDGWIPDKYFDGIGQALRHRDYCRRSYVGSFDVRPCSADHPARLEAATIGSMREAFNRE